VSIAGLEGEIAFATNAGSTVTMSGKEHCITGEFAESFAWYVYVVITEGVVTYVDEVAPDIAKPQFPSENH
jgi:hypothetical protein